MYFPSLSVHDSTPPRPTMWDTVWKLSPRWCDAQELADAMQLCISVVIELSRSVVVRTVHMRKHIIPVTRTNPYFDFRCEHDFRSWLIAMIE